MDEKNEVEIAESKQAGEPANTSRKTPSKNGLEDVKPKINTNLSKSNRKRLNPVRQGKLEALKLKLELQHKNLILLVEHNNLMHELSKQDGFRRRKVQSTQSVLRLEREIEKSTRQLTKEVDLVRSSQSETISKETEDEVMQIIEVIQEYFAKKKESDRDGGISGLI